MDLVEEIYMCWYDGARVDVCSDTSESKGCREFVCRKAFWKIYLHSLRFKNI